MDFYQDKDCPNYKHRHSWNSIYKYAALIKEHEGDLPLGDVGNIFDKGNIQYIMTDSLDKLQPYAHHLNMATWGGASEHKKRLSVLLPFKNEREEVALTCKSIRDTAGDMVEIIVLNDDSDKDFDYKASLAPYNVEYHESERRLGSSMGKQWCVDHCKTPYFLILDAHCRIYTKNWLKLALDELEKDEDCVYCCAVQYFSNEQDHQSPKHMKAFGGFWDYNIKSILSCGWNLHNFSYEKDRNLPSEKWEAFEVPCILGANYLCSKRWWDYLNGYNGLMLYGREETFISKKSWMAGGKVKCMPSILTGHKTRPNNHQPYACCAYEVIHNEMVNGYILFDDEDFNDLMEVWKSIHNPFIVRDAINLFNTHKEQLDMLRLQFRSIRKVSHDEVDAFNAAFQKKMGFNYALLQKNIEGTYTKYGEKKHKPIAIG